MKVYFLFTLYCIRGILGVLPCVSCAQRPRTRLALSQSLSLHPFSLGTFFFLPKQRNARNMMSLALKPSARSDACYIFSHFIGPSKSRGHC